MTKRMRFGWEQSPGDWEGIEEDFAFEIPPNISRYQPRVIQAGVDFTREIADIMVSFPTMRIECVLPARDLLGPVLQGPWLYRREIALVQILDVVQDALESKQEIRRVADVLALALAASPGGLREPFQINPYEALVLNVDNPSHDTETVWVRTIKWRYKGSR